MMYFFYLFFISPVKPVTIELQPFSDISKQEVTYVFNELKKVHPFIVLKQSIELPRSAFYSKRNRYRADTLIHYLSKRTLNNHVIIGLTTKDISTTKGNVYDWGVMGLSFCPGNACIASDFRLSNKDRYNQLFKVTIHELGHTQGLYHCPVGTCFMQSAKGKNSTSKEIGFCTKCKSFLVTKGWNFN